MLTLDQIYQLLRKSSAKAGINGTTYSKILYQLGLKSYTAGGRKVDVYTLIDTLQKSNKTAPQVQAALESVKLL